MGARVWIRVLSESLRGEKEMFLRIGNLLINTDHIAAVELEAVQHESYYASGDGQHHNKEFPCVRILTVLQQGEIGYGYSGCGSFDTRSFTFYGDDARRVATFFSSNTLETVEVLSHLMDQDIIT